MIPEINNGKWKTGLRCTLSLPYFTCCYFSKISHLSNQKFLRASEIPFHILHLITNMNLHFNTRIKQQIY
jgi:hypothetical protein